MLVFESCDRKKISFYVVSFIVCLSLTGHSAASVYVQPQAESITLPYTPDSEFLSLNVEEKDLFSSEEVLHFKLIVDYKELLKDRGEERGYHAAVISYKDKKGAVVTEELKVRVRGNRRRDPAVCKFPPLQLNFKRSTVKHTVFGDVNKLKMVTHCIGDDYVLREYLVYKLYNIVTDRSFKVRLCLVSYEDLHNKRKTEIRYGFLIEDDDSMAGRNGGVIVADELRIRMDRTDSLSMAMLAVFQFMIGNTDWSVPYRHNIEIIHVAPDYVAVPFDFDYCGMVNAPYAQPPPELGISSVQERLFRGYGFSDEIYKKVIDFFNLHRGEIYAVYNNSGMLSKRSKKYSLKYLDSFYKTLNRPKYFQREIVSAGDYNQKNIISIKGLEK